MEALLKRWKSVIHQVEEYDALRRVHDRRCYNAVRHALSAGGGRGQHARQAQQSHLRRHALGQVQVNDSDPIMRRAKRASIEDERQRLQKETEKAQIMQAVRRSQLDMIRQKVRGVLKRVPTRAKPRQPPPPLS